MVKINPAYDDKTLKEAARSFRLSGNLQLLSFGYFDISKVRFKRVYVPEKYSYSVGKVSDLGELQSVLRRLTGKSFKFLVMKFERGDYTLLYDELKPAKGIVVMLDLLDCDELWGGYTSFMKKDNELFRVVAKQGALTIINQSGLRGFNKYVNRHSQNPRIFLYGVQQK